MCVFRFLYTGLKIEIHSAKVVGVRFTLLYGKAISKVEYYYVAEQPLLASKRIGSSLRKKKFFGRKRLQNVSNFIIASHIKLFQSSNSSLFLCRPMHISFQMNILAARQKFFDDNYSLEKRGLRTQIECTIF